MRISNRQRQNIVKKTKIKKIKNSKTKSKQDLKNFGRTLYSTKK